MTGTDGRKIVKPAEDPFYWDVRQALLGLVAAVERHRLGRGKGAPTTSDRCHVAKALESGDMESVKDYVRAYGPDSETDER